MSVYASIHLFFKKKYTYKGIHHLFKSLKLDDFSLSPIQKSHVYNETDLRRYEGRFSFMVEDKKLIFCLVVEEYEGEEGTNTVELEFTGSNRATYEYVYFSDNFFSIFKKMKYLEGIALVGDDAAAPCNNIYDTFKRGGFDMYLQPIT